MSDLINREEVIKVIKSYFKSIIDSSDNNEIDHNILDYNKYINIAIKEIPTAYSVDEVVEQLEDEIRVIKNNICVEQSEALQNKLVHRLQQTEKILFIVKGGGQGE